MNSVIIQFDQDGLTEEGQKYQATFIRYGLDMLFSNDELLKFLKKSRTDEGRRLASIIQECQSGKHQMIFNSSL